MITFIIGTDINARKTIIERIAQNRPLENMREEFDHVIAEQVLSGGLFGDPSVVVIRNGWSADLRAWLKRALKEYGDRDIIIVEESLPKKETDTLVKGGAIRHDVLEKKEKTVEDKGIFAIAQSFADRKKKDAWLAYHRELRKGSAAEQIHGILVWKVRNLAEKHDRTMGHDERMRLMEQLVTTYHDSHRSGPELELALEHILLSL